MTKQTSFWDKTIRSGDGKLRLWQKPNAPIITWAVARILVWPLTGSAEHLARLVAFGALFTWAWMELFQGINYARRLLGFSVLVVSVISAVHSGRIA